MKKNKIVVLEVLCFLLGGLSSYLIFKNNSTLPPLSKQEKSEGLRGGI